MNVLVLESGGGAGIATIEILKMNNNDIKIIAADCDKFAGGLYLAHEGVVLPHISNPLYTGALIRLCETKNISAIMPTFEWGFDLVRKLELPFLTDLESAILCKDKLQFAQRARSAGLDVPLTVPLRDAHLTPPFFVKPRYGAGSRGIGIVRKKEDATYFLNSGINYVAQELLHGQHYSVDVLVHQKKFITAVPRANIRVRSGEPVTVRIEKNEIIMGCAKQVTERLGIKSTFNLEGFLDAGTFFINEINVRFGSGIIFPYLAGVNFPAYLLGFKTNIKFRAGVFTTISRGLELK